MFTKVLLHQFRKYDQAKLDLQDHQYIEGPNGFGKTTMLEAIFWLLSGYSPLGSESQQFIPHHWTGGVDETVSFTAAEIQDERHTVRRIIRWQPVGEGYKGSASLLLDGKPTNQRTLHKHYVALFFSPEYIDLLSQQRSRRLEWLDRLGKIILPGYSQVNTNYTQVLRQRNRYLQTARRESFFTPGYQPNVQLLATFNQQLAALGEALLRQRKQLIEIVNSHQVAPRYQLAYDQLKPLDFSPETQAKERLVGRTLRGPHLDDWSIADTKRKQNSVLYWGSRGQRKLALLSLLISLIGVYQAERQLQPLILLDDPANELDQKNTAIFRELLTSGEYQVIETQIKS